MSFSDYSKYLNKKSARVNCCCATGPTGPRANANAFVNLNALAINEAAVRSTGVLEGRIGEAEASITSLQAQLTSIEDKLDAILAQGPPSQ
jgi:hypothetical protein